LKIKELKAKEKRFAAVAQLFVANEIVAYAKQFPKSVIVMENSNEIRNNFDKLKSSTRDSKPAVQKAPKNNRIQSSAGRHRSEISDKEGKEEYL